MAIDEDNRVFGVSSGQVNDWYMILFPKFEKVEAFPIESILFIFVGEQKPFEERIE